MPEKIVINIPKKGVEIKVEKVAGADGEPIKIVIHFVPWFARVDSQVFYFTDREVGLPVWDGEFAFGLN